MGAPAFYRAIYDVGRRFSWNPLRVRDAAGAAQTAHEAYLALMLHEGLTPPQAMTRLFGAEDHGSMVYQETGDPAATTTVALLGHPYMLHDEYLNHRLLRRLRTMGIRLLTPEMATADALRAGTVKLAGAPYWTFDSDVTGAGGHYLDRDGVDGVIALLAFGCGPDSIMAEMVNRYARGRGKPFMILTVDEHTAEAGLVTRLEAFADMLRRRQQSGVALCG